MSAKGLGMTTVVEADGRLAGILTDGDLRRLMEKHRGAVLEMCAADGMTKTPQTIGPHVLAGEALSLVEHGGEDVLEEFVHLARCAADVGRRLALLRADGDLQGFERRVAGQPLEDRKSTRLNSSHATLSRMP